MTRPLAVTGTLDGRAAGSAQELVARLGIHPRLITVAAALGSAPGAGTFYRPNRATISGMISDWEGEQGAR